MRGIDGRTCPGVVPYRRQHVIAGALAVISPGFVPGMQRVLAPDGQSGHVDICRLDCCRQ